MVNFPSITPWERINRWGSTKTSPFSTLPWKGGTTNIRFLNGQIKRKDTRVLGNDLDVIPNQSTRRGISGSSFHFQKSCFGPWQSFVIISTEIHQLNFIFGNHGGTMNGIHILLLCFIDHALKFCLKLFLNFHNSLRIQKTTKQVHFFPSDDQSIAANMH